MIWGSWALDMVGRSTFSSGNCYNKFHHFVCSVGAHRPHGQSYFFCAQPVTGLVLTFCIPLRSKQHQGPPEGFCYEIQDDGNPLDPSEVKWTTSCPLACLQLLWSLQKKHGKPRRYFGTFWNFQHQRSGQVWNRLDDCYGCNHS